MRGRLAAMTAVLLGVVLLAGCGSSQAGETERDVPEIRISGSGTCLPLIEVLTEAYPQRNDVDFVYLPGLHSGGGIKGIDAGELDIGAVSRDLDVDEKALGLTYTGLSSDGLAIAVHPSVTIDGLTTQQVKDIYAGKYSNWLQLGGPDLPIVILDRNEEESAKIVLREYVLGDTKVTEDAIALFYEQDMVEGLEKTPGAIGYFSYGFSVAKDVQVTLVKLDGVTPSVATIDDGTYKVVRPLGVVTEPETKPEVEAFLKWATGKEAVRLMEEKGYAAAQSANSQ